MLLDRSAYLSPQSDAEAVELVLERIWLDWKSKQLIQPSCKPIGVDQAVTTILTQVHTELIRE
jgi:hypothetical protein